MTDHSRSDHGPFHEIAPLHRPHLKTIALRLAGTADRAEDLVQETLLRALLHFGRFEQGTNVRAWLVTILTRLYLDQEKHEKVVRKAEPALNTLELVVPEIDLESPDISDTALRNAVDALEKDLRDVVECCYMQQLSYKEAADKLQVPIGTIGTRLQRARERLKGLLASGRRTR